MKIRKSKKIMAALLAATAFCAAAIPAYASSTGTDNQSMDLNISKTATYTMSIPSTQSNITFGTVDTIIGDVSVTGNIGTKQQVRVTVEKTDFVDAKDNTNKFSFELLNNGTAFSGQVWDSDQVRAAQAVAYPLTVRIPQTTWDTVKAGSYKATLTFQAELKEVQP